MTYATLRDEGYAQLEGDLGLEASCPEDCEERDTCGICQEACCPTHGLPVTTAGELTPGDTVLRETCQGSVHRACHTFNCTSKACWEDEL